VRSHLNAYVRERIIEQHIDRRSGGEFVARIERRPG
jgi:hypothetical protein